MKFMECIFCKIVKNEIPNHRIYEDRSVVAFLDIAPTTKGHVLVVPKMHAANLEEMDDLSLAYVTAICRKISMVMKKAIGAKGYNLVVNNGSEAGQLINHFHFHIIPRYKKTELPAWPHASYSASEAQALCKKLKAALC